MRLCLCLPLLAAIVGRQLDVLQTPDGGRLPGEFFPHLLKELPAVQRFQVVQERLDDVCIRIVAAPEFGPRAETALLQRARERLGTQVNIRIERVAQIARTRNGKFRQIVSRLSRSSESNV